MNLTFPITEYPEWRGDKNKYIPGVKVMLKDIVSYIKRWEKFQTQTDPIDFRQKICEIKEKYIYRTQIVENIGVKTEEETVAIIKKIEGGIKKLSTKRKPSRGSDDSTVKRYKSVDKNSNLLDTHKNRLDTNNAEDKENIDLNKSSTDGSAQVPTTQEILIKSLQHTDCTEKKKRETMNLYKGLLFFENIIAKENCSTNKEKEDLDKLLDVSECIKRPHEILTKDVLSNGKIPGQFSTCKRYGEFNNQIYHYPHFKTEKIAEAAVQSIVDEYHKHLDAIKKEMKKAIDLKVLEKIFKVATSLLFSFLQLHPFSDGNGRLGRLLCSHVLGLFSPFPTAIYNVFSPTHREDYVKALVNARIGMNDTEIQDQIKHEQISTENEAIRIAYRYLAASPSDLCALIIESNWCTWRQLMSIDR